MCKHHLKPEWYDRLIANIKEQPKQPRLNPLRADPSRTATLRRAYWNNLARRFDRLQRQINKLIIDEDVFGWKVTANTRWRFLSNSQKVAAFKAWLKLQIDQGIIELHRATDDGPWQIKYVESAYKKGLDRAYAEVHKRELNKKLPFYEGSKKEFLDSTFKKPVSLDRVKLLAGRQLTDLQGITEAMSVAIDRELVDGMIRGESPRQVAARIAKQVNGVGKRRAFVMSQTETLRAHNEGALEGYEELGVEELGVAVEWDTADDGRVCPLCRPLDGVILTVQEAKGMFPRHALCRCVPIPANVGEDTSKQKRTRGRIKAAIARSLEAEIPKKSKRSVETQRKLSPWYGAGRVIAKVRPKSIV